MTVEAKDIFTFAGLFINAIGLIAALVKFSQEQKKANILRQAEADSTARAEKRTEYKLRIYLSLLDDRMLFEEIVNKFGEQTPVTSRADPVELRKSLYEMLVEGTLVAYDDKTYSANTIEDDDREAMEEDEPARRYNTVRRAAKI
jgi:hypothetical protein